MGFCLTFLLIDVVSGLLVAVLGVLVGYSVEKNALAWRKKFASPGSGGSYKCERVVSRNIAITFWLDWHVGKLVVANKTFYVNCCIFINAPQRGLMRL